MKISISIIFCLLFFINVLAQQKAIFPFFEEDSVLKNKILNTAEEFKKKSIASLGKEHQKEFREIYEDRFKLVKELFEENRILASPEANEYLQSILKIIVSSNKELKDLPIRLIFSKDCWPNAYSIGEGTLVVNAGLFIYLKNEAELVFVICHELSHLYLDHGNNAIRKNIDLITSQEFQNKLKRISKQEYGAGAELDKLFKNFAFGIRRHSRENEAEADRQALNFMKNTGFDCKGSITCLRLLDTIDEARLFDTISLPSTFTFPGFQFNMKWLNKESSIFGAMTEDDSPLTKNEIDSLKTHPNCKKRIKLLEPELDLSHNGNSFLIDSTRFEIYKTKFPVEMAEQLFFEKNYSRYLYYSLLLSHSAPYRPYALLSIAKVMNALFISQRDHTFGLVTDKETRGYPDEYNMVLRFIDRLRLEELAQINYYFCQQISEEMNGYSGFESEKLEATKNWNLYNH